MSVNQIPLETRLKRLREGYASDPEFNVSAIKTMAKLPIRAYLAGWEEELKKLKELLFLTEEDIQTMTYQEVACYIHRLPNTIRHQEISRQAVRILALPFKKCYQERKQAYV